ncbi:MAG: glycosyltransferase [Brevinematales bacterium]|nr:glycosyltransferase [Brevinematales bacterium]
MNEKSKRISIFIPQVGTGLKAGICGGGTRFFELLRAMIRDGGFDITIGFTSGGLETFRNYFANDPVVIDAIKVIPIRASLFLKNEPFRLFRAWSYFVSTLHLRSLTRRKDFGSFDIGLSPSDFFYHIEPLVKMKKKGKIAKLFSTSYHRYPKPGERKGIYLINWFMYRQQKNVFRNVSKYSDRLFINGSAEGREIAKELLQYGYSGEPIYVDLGVDKEFIDTVPADPEKKFTLIHIGMRTNKGIYDLPAIWAAVLAKFPDATLGMIGGISAEDKYKLTAEFEKLGANRNLEYLGYIFDEKKFALMKSAKLFIAPSHEEGWGIAVGEAMACGIPVAGYDLIAYKSVYGEAISYARSFDTAEFAEKVCALLSSPEEYESYQKKGTATILKYDWKEIFARELEYYKKG